MRILELFESSEEDRALISLSSAILDTTAPYRDDASTALVNIGKIGDLFDTSIPGLNHVSISVAGGDVFLKHYDPDADLTKDWAGKVPHAFWDEATHEIVLNKDLLTTHRMKTTITHELRHALDEFKSKSYPGGGAQYFRPRKKSHRKEYRDVKGDLTSDSRNRIPYLAQPAEINARFIEILHQLSIIIPKRYASVTPNLIKKQLTHDFKNLLAKYEIADLYPEKTTSKHYQRLVKRAYDFMEKEMKHVESELGNGGSPKSATGQW